MADRNRFEIRVIVEPDEIKPTEFDLYRMEVLIDGIVLNSTAVLQRPLALSAFDYFSNQLLIKLRKQLLDYERIYHDRKNPE